MRSPGPRARGPRPSRLAARHPAHPAGPAHVIGGAVTQSVAHEASLRFTSPTGRGSYAIAALTGELGIATAPAPARAAPQPAPRRQPADHRPVRGRARGRQRPSGAGGQRSPRPAARRIPAPGRAITRGSQGPVSHRHEPAPRYLSHGPGCDHRPAETARRDLPAGNCPGSRPHRWRHRGRGCTIGYASH